MPESENIDRLEMKPVAGPVHGTARPPGSKSITNRALVCAALADGTSVLHGALASDDTAVMVDSLRRLGIEVAEDAAAKTITVRGCGGRIPSHGAELFIGNSGTTIRFLAAACALGHGTFRLDGVPRMRERPIGDLVEALAQCGVKIQALSTGGCPPVVIEAAGLLGGRVTVRGDISSQFLSGLLLAAPCADGPINIHVDGTLVSIPYVQMTLDVMQSFGVAVESQTSGDYRVPAPQSYRSREYHIEPDASAASYFWAVAALTQGSVKVTGLSLGSLQGDVRFCECLAQMGCDVTYMADSITITGRPLHGIDVDMNAISDTVQTLSVVALLADGPTTIRGVGHIRHKETDRIGNLAIELRKLGATVDVLPDGLRIVPGALRGAEIETYDDHRMAMSLALAGLVQEGVVVLNPGCTAKTYPEFFEDLSRLTRTGERGA
ncbi:MAG: 3-phosphoshikimate 1-carboxyvinyltransferase [Planctomycetes bacterium]|nr:3-phosphoshikimate 1-carboxyvinyltransferase [Planctomycetota bacterium]